MSVFLVVSVSVEIERRGASTKRSKETAVYRGEAKEEKEARYILYDSVIAFPRTNIALAERAQENVRVNRGSFLLLSSIRPSASRSL